VDSPTPTPPRWRVLAGTTHWVDYRSSGTTVSVWQLWMMLEMLLLLLKLSPHWMQVISSVSVTVLPGGEGAVCCVCYHEMQYPVLINNLRILHCLTVFRQVATLGIPCPWDQRIYS